MHGKDESREKDGGKFPKKGKNKADSQPYQSVVGKEEGQNSKL